MPGFEKTLKDISIHAPTRGATRLFNEADYDFKFQSTLPREERHSANDFIKLAVAISIHAPTRGATAILHKKSVYFYTIPIINI